MNTATTTRPDKTEYAPFYAGYVAEVADGNIIDVMRSSSAELNAALATIPEAMGGHRYANGKWSVREVLGHLIDGERIFSYRALRIARGDVTPLASFDENAYVPAAGSEARTIAELARELAIVRESTLLLLESLPADAWVRRGTASGNSVSVRALAYITTGHARHHLNVLRERYGVGA